MPKPESLDMRIAVEADAPALATFAARTRCSRDFQAHTSNRSPERATSV